MAVNYVKFQRGSQEAYDALKAAGQLDTNTLYFIYKNEADAVGALYMGNRIISGGDITIASATLDDLAEKFFLSKPYISKYIKEKSGVTFGELVKKIRMKKARALLKSSNMTVENIALSVGYQNVEHFNRLFKKAYNMTPIQFRNEK